MAKHDTVRSTGLTRRGAIGAIGAAGLGLIGARASAQSPANWAEVEAAARKEGRLTLYHNLRPQGVEPLFAEFRKSYPEIQTEQVRLGSAPLIERFATEFAADRNIADVMVTFPDEALLRGIDSGGWAVEWTPPEFAAFPSAANYKNRMFTVQTGRNVIIWNKSRVKPDQAPKEWADLADPRWKGRVGMDPPWRSVPVQALLAYWEDIGFKDAAEKFKANDVRFFEGSAGVMQAVLRGDAWVATLVDLPLEPALEDGAPIGWAYPKTGTVTASGFTFASSRAPHANAARVFVNWLLSAKGQEVLQAQGGLAVTRPGTPPLKILPPTSALKTVDQMQILTPERQKQVIETWRAVFGIR